VCSFVVESVKGKKKRDKMNDLQVTLQKERREFGKQCLFSDKKYLMVSLPPNRDEKIDDDQRFLSYDDKIRRQILSQQRSRIKE
jgi:hypothetical protein